MPLLSAFRTHSLFPLEAQTAGGHGGYGAKHGPVILPLLAACIHLLFRADATAQRQPSPTGMHSTRLLCQTANPFTFHANPFDSSFFFHLEAFSQNKENFRSHFPSRVRVRVCIYLLTYIYFFPHTRNVHPHPLRSFPTASTSDSGYRGCLRLRLCPQGQGCNHLPLLLTSQISSKPLTPTRFPLSLLLNPYSTSHE